MAKCFFYCDGRELLKGDKVRIAGDYNYNAVVEEVFQPHTKRAADYACFETGGFMLTSEKTGCEVWEETDEDIELIERSS